MTSIDDPRNVFYLPSSTSVDPQIKKIFVDTGEFITLIAHNLSILGGIVADTITAETVGGPVTFNSDINMAATKKITMNGVTVIDSNRDATFNRVNTETFYNINNPNPVMDADSNFNVRTLSLNGDLVIKEDLTMIIGSVDTGNILMGAVQFVDVSRNVSANSMTIAGTSFVDSSKNLDINTIAVNGSQLVDASKNISSNSVATNSISIVGNTFVDNTRTIFATNINGSALSISNSSAFIGGRQALVNSITGASGLGVIFGTIAANGTVLKGSPLDFTCSNIGVGLYTITFQGAVGFDSSSPIVVTFNDTGNWGYITVEHQGIANQVLIVTRNSAGVLTNYRFTFFANLFV